MIKAPEKVPENGFYYHYKHDPTLSINNYAYEVIGVGHHTEEEGLNMVIYRPLYESEVYKAGKLFDLRPIDMWMGNVEKENKIFKRFTKIIDANTISQLEKIKSEMYRG